MNYDTYCWRNVLLARRIVGEIYIVGETHCWRVVLLVRRVQFVKSAPTWLYVDNAAWARCDWSGVAHCFRNSCRRVLCQPWRPLCVGPVRARVSPRFPRELQRAAAHLAQPVHSPRVLKSSSFSPFQYKMAVICLGTICFLLPSSWVEFYSPIQVLKVNELCRIESITDESNEEACITRTIMCCIKVNAEKNRNFICFKFK